MSAEYVIQLYFAACCVVILSVNTIPALRRRFLAYGPRNDNGESKSPSDKSSPPPTYFARGLDMIAHVCVPHSWFIHFYLLSTVSSIFWGYQIFARGSIFRLVSSTSSIDRKHSMSLDQILLTWFLMLAQGLRRLLECLFVSKTSSSKMWLPHWVVGILFYAAMGVAVWIEGSATLETAKLTLDHFTIRMPSFRSAIGIPIFLLASGMQYDCHAYLASLKTYTIPAQPIFQVIICPHYFAECLIYLSLSMIAAPPGQLLNKTIFAALGFVVITLGVTADNTKQWYVKRFGEQSVHTKWRMVPYVF